MILCAFVFIFIIIIYFLSKYVFNEKQIHHLKYGLYVGLVMTLSVIMTPIFLLRPRNAWNIRLGSIIINPLLNLFGLKYIIENGEILSKTEHGVIVANHQSSVDFIGMMHLWTDHIRYCTILAKKELFWALPFGFTAWLAGVEYVDRKNREKSSETMRLLANKVHDQSLRVWIFPEGTRNMSDKFLPFKFGAFRLAIDAQVPIIPVVFSSYKSIYDAEKSTNSYFWRQGVVTIKCLEPIETKGMTIDNDLQKLTDLTREHMFNAYQQISSNRKDN